MMQGERQSIRGAGSSILLDNIDAALRFTFLPFGLSSLPLLDERSS